MSDPQDVSSAIPQWLKTISDLDTTAAIHFLEAEGMATIDTCATLADLSLSHMEVDLDQAQQWLAVGVVLHERLAVDVEPTVPVWLAATAQLTYAQARLAVYRGELEHAEELLRQAQAAWEQAQETAGAARTFLGLTQVLAMQGRYAEAEEAAHSAVALLRIDDSNADDLAVQSHPSFRFARRLQLAGAHHNLATLYVYTERHDAALRTYEVARTQLNAIDQSVLRTDEQATLTMELAHNALNRASALTFLDQPDAAEAALHQAIRYFEAINDLSDRGRAQTNLGRLYLRTGRYAAALTAFDRATTDLIGETASATTLPLDVLRRADELLLEQAMGYLVMNLLPEAEQALARCEALFRSADQPYELGQTLYLWGLLRLRATEWASAQPLLAEAAADFATLQNYFWLNRTQLAQAALAYRQADHQGAMAILDALLTDAETHVSGADLPPEAESLRMLRWDLAGLSELYLLRLRIQIDGHAFADAEASATVAAAQIGLDLVEVRALLASTQPLSTEASARVTGALPHYALRLHHLLGRLAQATGDSAMAQAHLQQALAILEQQRATLPVEEIRTAFLDDKTEIYVDLIQLLLALADDDPTLMAAAFATVERARSRALLERLLTATSDASGPGADHPTDTNTVAAEQLDALRQRLHWLYNQLLGESGSRNLNTRLSEQLLQEEAALQRLEWRRSTLLQQAEPVDLATFQAALAPDQQAIVYTILGSKRDPVSTAATILAADPLNVGAQATDDTGAEVMAFLIDRNSIIAHRHLTTTTTLHQAMDELRFQLGRAELGSEYVARHQERLRTRLNEILGHIYQLLLAPLRPTLTAQRLLIVPAGPLHRLPFHALWDGSSYLLTHYECSYAPSASVVVMRRKKQSPVRLRRRWAGLAVDDVAIPAARAEVTGAARYFADAKLYLDAEAGRNGLERAAQTDVLHLATHGLFRPDNPFFSALKLADGWIDVREIYRLPLQAQLVILSACESGAGQIRGGDEVVGLARGFLGAGANEILASLWNVHDASAVTLMDHFYQYFIHDVQDRPAAALRAAQIDAISAQQHPYFWAPFFVIGD